MLNVTLGYKLAIKEITSDDNSGLSEYLLSQSEWVILKNLCDVLKVGPLWLVTDPLVLHVTSQIYDSPSCPGLQRRNTVFLTVNTQSGDSDSSNGSYW